MTYTAIIIDDEMMGAESLSLLIEKYCNEITVLAVCTNPGDGVEKVKLKKPQIVFLDIEMPELNGFDVLDRLKNE